METHRRTRPPKNDLEAFVIMAYIHYRLARERVQGLVRKARAYMESLR